VSRKFHVMYFKYSVKQHQCILSLVRESKDCNFKEWFSSFKTLTFSKGSLGSFLSILIFITGEELSTLNLSVCYKHQLLIWIIKHHFKNECEGFMKLEKHLKPRGRRPSGFIVFEHLDI